MPGTPPATRKRNLERIASTLFVLLVVGFVIYLVIAIINTSSSHVSLKPTGIVSTDYAAGVTSIDTSSISGDFSGNKDVVVLNNWLRQSPDRRVSSFTVVPGWRGASVEAYVLYWLPGSNASEQFFPVTLANGNHQNDSPSFKHNGWGGAEMADWIASHPTDTPVAFAGVPNQGELRGFRVLAETKP